MGNALNDINRKVGVSLSLLFIWKLKQLVNRGTCEATDKEYGRVFG